MSDLIQINNDVTTVDVSPKLDKYSRVTINIDENTQVSVGDDSGLTLEFDNPFGNKDMATRVLASLKNFRYSPYKASGAELDPAAEIGDAVETATSFGGIYTRSRSFGKLMKSDISAPCDEEIDHEFQYESPSERKFKRAVGDVRASIELTNTKIALEVQNRENADSDLASSITQTASSIISTVSSTITTKVGEETTRAEKAEKGLGDALSDVGDDVSAIKKSVSTLEQTSESISASVSTKLEYAGGENKHNSFSWTLTSDGHRWYADGNTTPVMAVTASGLTVNGIINAKQGGTIGGFNIGASAIYKDIPQIDEILVSGSTGVYIGTNGIRLGNTFKVTSQGALTAESGKIGGFNIKASAIYNNISTFGATNINSGVYVGTNGIQLGKNFKVDSQGAMTATSGKIGGFDIGSDKLTYNGLSYGSTDKSRGVYIGTSGIQLGKYFQVDTSGAVKASSLALTGDINFYDGNNWVGSIGAKDFYDATETVIDEHGKWDDAATSTSEKGYCYGGAGCGYNWEATKVWGTSGKPNLYLGALSATSVATSSFVMGSYSGYWGDITVNGTTYTVLKGAPYG